MTKPTPNPGQEWERTHKDPSQSVRIRIVEWEVDERTGWPAPRGTVESLLSNGRWGRRRELGIFSLSNTPSGYRLVKEAP